jgi:hypothetical protein
VPSDKPPGKDPRDGIVLRDPAAVARSVRVRRFKRRLKAAVSLAIAAAAGTYVACKGDDHRPNPPPNPTTGEISNLPAPPDAGVDGSPKDAAVDARADAALVGPVDARRDGGVDRTEHRKGMPVPDNLLE